MIHALSSITLVRQTFLLFSYTLLATASLLVAYCLRFDLVIPEAQQLNFYTILVPFVLLKLALLYGFGQFGSFLSYFRIPDLFRLFWALSTASLLLAAWWFFGQDGSLAPPRSVILADYLLSIILFPGYRVTLRFLRERFLEDVKAEHKAAPIAIIGASNAGSTVAADLLSKRSLGMRPVVFLDDDPSKHGKTIHGIPVEGTPDDLLSVAEQYGLKKVVLALPSSAVQRIRGIVQMANSAKLETAVIPSLGELASGKVRASQLRSVELEDILGREPVELDSGEIEHMVKHRVAMVTGAGGSIGAELCRQLVNLKPERIILLEQSEAHLFLIERELEQNGYGGVVTPVVANILDGERMEYIFERYKPQLIFHAAAHKHVPMMEHQPQAAIYNNSIGSFELAKLAIRHNCERFVLISTDKAINPTSVMGASKRMAELFTQSLQDSPKNKTRFIAVRFGNVLGSSGSVIPIFKEQIAAGGPVTVTHPDVTRYFMTIPEAVGLVLQAASQGQGGEIFILDMGQPMKIVDVARQLIQLSGLEPDVDIQIEFTGLRPGEKLFEELQHNLESLKQTPHKRIFCLSGEPQSLKTSDTQAASFRERLYKDNRSELKRLLKRYIPEYKPFFD